MLHGRHDRRMAAAACEALVKAPRLTSSSRRHLRPRDTTCSCCMLSAWLDPLLETHVMAAPIGHDPVRLQLRTQTAREPSVRDDDKTYQVGRATVIERGEGGADELAVHGRQSARFDAGRTEAGGER